MTLYSSVALLQVGTGRERQCVLREQLHAEAGLARDELTQQAPFYMPCLRAGVPGGLHRGGGDARVGHQRCRSS